MSKAQEQAKEFAAECKARNWSYSARSNPFGGIVTIEKTFTPHDNNGFVECDSEYYSILSLAPATSPGSIWGTDGGGMGAISAINSGRFRMNKSGISKRFISALEKL